MNFKLHTLSLLALLIAHTSVSAEDVNVKTECQPLRSTQVRQSAKITQPDISLICGSNTVSQTVNTPSVSATPTVSSSSGNATANTTTLVAFISATAGVLGALAGGISSYLVAREKAKSDLELETKRLQANLVATERLRWLQDIRARLSNLYVQLDLQYDLLKRSIIPGTSTTTQQQLDAMSSEIMEQCNMITLMLNPAKPDQAALHNTLQRALGFMMPLFQQDASGPRVFNDAEYRTYKQAAFDSMTRLGVDTWKQVKSLS